MVRSSILSARPTRARGEKAANAKLQEVAQLPIQVVDADMDLTKLAASLKAAPTGSGSSTHNLPYADCFAAALAQSRQAALVTTDKDFARAASALKILWI